MKKALIFTLMLVLSAPMFGQCLSVINGSKSRPFPPDRYNTYLYLDGSLDVNNIFGYSSVSNEPQGLDYDLEIGYRKAFVGYYGFLGEYREIKYQNFGFGVDLFIIESRTFDVSFGPNLGGIKRDGGNWLMAYAFRVKPVLALTEEIAIFGKGQYQHRPDRNIHGAFELAAGIQFKIL
jgi:hypothetical protein